MEILITVLTYSTIITAVQLYKDSSSYSFGPDTIDIVISGPVMWVVLFVGNFIVCPLHKIISKHCKQTKKTVKLYSEKKAKRIVAKIIKVYKKETAKNPYWCEDCFVMQRHYFDCYGNDGIDGLEKLPIKKARYEYLNKKYFHLLYNQFDLLLEIIQPYFERWTEADYIENEFDEYWIERHKNDELWRVK